MNFKEYNTSQNLLKTIQSLSSHNQQDLLETLLNSLPLVVVITDKNGSIEYVNQQFEKLTGYSKREVLFKNPRILKTVNQLDVNYGELWEQISSGKEWHGTFCNQTKSGELFWEKAHISPLFNNENELTHFLALKEDISEQTRLYNTLESTEYKYQHIFNTMSTGYAYHKLICNDQGQPVDYIFLDTNPAFENLTGLKKSQCINKSVKTIFPNIDNLWIERYGKVALEGGHDQFDEYFKELGRWYQVNVSSMGDLEFTVLFTDVTKERLADEKNSQLVSNLESNVKQLQLLYSLSSLSGRKDTELEEFIQEALDSLNMLFKNNYSLRYYFKWGEVQYGKPSFNGSFKLFTTQVQLNNAQVDFEIWSTLNDSSESLFSEIKVVKLFFKELIHHCEIKILEKNLADQQEQVFQASKLVSLGELTSGVAHEINNPCNYILLNSGILEELQDELNIAIRETLDGTQPQRDIAEIQKDIKHFNTTINEGAIRIRNTVQSLKDYSKKNNTENFLEVDLLEIVSNAAAILNSTIKKSTYHFKIDIDPKTYVYGHFHQLEQVFINIISNACRSLESKDNRITINCKNLPRESQILISILDEGKGIPANLLSKVTDPFFTTYRTQGGTGLGLSISHQIITKHKGTLKFFSDTGKGTDVQIKLPMNKISL